MQSIVRHVTLDNGRPDYQFGAVKGNKTLVATPMATAGWRVTINQADVGDIMPINVSENWKITPLEIVLNETSVATPSEDAVVEDGLVRATAPSIRDAFELVAEMI